jgi:hypothetical protein
MKAKSMGRGEKRPIRSSPDCFLRIPP